MLNDYPNNPLAPTTGNNGVGIINNSGGGATALPPPNVSNPSLGLGAQAPAVQSDLPNPEWGRGAQLPLVQPTQPAQPTDTGSQALNVYNQNGVQGGGGFLPGPAQIQSPNGGSPTSLSFQSVNGNPFGAQASGIYSRS